MRAGWQLLPLGNIVDLQVAGHRTGRRRRVLLGLLHDDGRRFLGHPNGVVEWTRNLGIARDATVVLRPGRAIRIQATPLEAGPLRDRAILATSQHPFPGNLIYRLASSHIRAVGTFFEIQPIDVAEGRPPQICEAAAMTARSSASRNCDAHAVPRVILNGREPAA